ncbi:MAG: hypothetical protein IT546_05235 [Caulobacteraceae bacterium]|nr:hypothetical protein [Caulobacteraceae bacterium]
MLGYQRQDSPLTLAEGLEEYYLAHPGLKRGETLSADARAFFERHDAVHVVYGCDTTLPQEAIVKLASFFGTTEGLKVMEGYRLYDSLDIYRQLRLADILATLARVPVLVPRTIWRCRRQAKPWPWDDFDDGLDTPLAALRAKYGLRVAA